jgi:hypothetical protein
MTQLLDSRTGLDRWLALLVRYWAFNITLIRGRGSHWSGFGYSDDEKIQLRAIAGKVPIIEYHVWLGLVVVFVFFILTGIVIIGLNYQMYAIGEEQNMTNTPAPVFFLQLALDVVVSLSIGFPAAMLPAAALVGRLFGVEEADLPDPASTAYFFHKLWFQITRAAAITLCALVPTWIFIFGASKFWVIARLLAPLVSPAVAALAVGYYLSARLKRNERSGG